MISTTLTNNIVHCNDNCEKAGKYSVNRTERIRLGNKQAIVFENDDIIIIIIE